MSGRTMKGLVVFDSVHGNTKQVAEAIAEQIRADGHGAEVRNLRAKQAVPSEGDFLFVGSPTRMSKMTGKAKKFVKKLDVEVWRGKPIVAFDTILPMPTEGASDKEKRDAEKYIVYGAAPRMRDLMKARGLSPREEVLRLTVTGMKGPLASGALELAKKYTHDFVLSLKK